MVNPDPSIFVINKQAMEQYCREEGIPARHVPDLVSKDDDVLAGVRGFVQSVRRVLAARKSLEVRLHRAEQGAIAKSR